MLGVDDRWRHRAVVETNLRPGGSVIDVCCGDGRMTALLAERVGPFGRVEGVDVSADSVEAAISGQHALVQASFQVADALSLPFPDDTFDAATSCFGLRRLADVGAGLRELARVVRPGGRVVILELAMPVGRVRRASYRHLCRITLPVTLRMTGHIPAAYSEFTDTLETFPSPVSLSLLMEHAGLSDVLRHELTAGIASLHRGTVHRGTVRQGAAGS